jgi:iron-sulfur cluster repair protein YtfE (RIC family)
MSTILDFLGQDHRACDEHFATAEAAVAQKRWDSARSQFAAFRASMAHHFAMEEEVLFPAFEARTGNAAGPTQVMRMEHRQMRELMDEMDGALAEARQDAFLGLSETLNMVMQQHNLKEENMLYPMSDRVLGADGGGVVRAMAAIPAE